VNQPDSNEDATLVLGVWDNTSDWVTPFNGPSQSCLLSRRSMSLTTPVRKTTRCSPPPHSPRLNPT